MLYQLHIVLFIQKFGIIKLLAKDKAAITPEVKTQFDEFLQKYNQSCDNEKILCLNNDLELVEFTSQIVKANDFEVYEDQKVSEDERAKSKMLDREKNKEKTNTDYIQQSNIDTNEIENVFNVQSSQSKSPDRDKFKQFSATESKPNQDSHKQDTNSNADTFSD